ncbi:hypothetical protein GVC23_002043 [Salmonella enterica]|nr:hypothetical protein [Salmonella enterica]
MFIQTCLRGYSSFDQCRDGEFNRQGKQLSFFTLQLCFVFSVFLILFNLSVFRR